MWVCRCIRKATMPWCYDAFFKHVVFINSFVSNWINVVVGTGFCLSVKIVCHCRDVTAMRPKTVCHCRGGYYPPANWFVGTPSWGVLRFSQHSFMLSFSRKRNKKGSSKNSICFTLLSCFTHGKKSLRQRDFSRFWELLMFCSYLAMLCFLTACQTEF